MFRLPLTWLLECNLLCDHFISCFHLWLLLNLLSSAGASLVQWNRVNGNFLASAHDSDIRIWDMRVWKRSMIFSFLSPFSLNPSPLSPLPLFSSLPTSLLFLFSLFPLLSLSPSLSSLYHSSLLQVASSGLFLQLAQTINRHLSIFFLIFHPQKSTTASGYITAHMSRIHDLDWSYSDERQLTTCSHDASIKFWDTATPREPTSSIKAGAQPLWRARNYVSVAGSCWDNAAAVVHGYCSWKCLKHG